MDTSKTRDLPAGLEGVRRRFERWRRTRRGASRIPDPLWAAAVKVAGTLWPSPDCQGAAAGLLLAEGTGRAGSRAQHRCHQSEASKCGRPGCQDAGGGPKVLASDVKARVVRHESGVGRGCDFVELPTPAWAACGECIVELEDRAGRRCGSI